MTNLALYLEIEFYPTIYYMLGRVTYDLSAAHTITY